MDTPKVPIECMRVVGCGSSQIRIMRDDTVRFKFFSFENDARDDGIECARRADVPESHKAKFDAIAEAFNIKFGEEQIINEAPWVAEKIISIDAWEPVAVL